MLLQSSSGGQHQAVLKRLKFSLKKHLFRLSASPVTCTSPSAGLTLDCQTLVACPAPSGFMATLDTLTWTRLTRVSPQETLYGCKGRGRQRVRTKKIHNEHFARYFCFKY